MSRLPWVLVGVLLFVCAWLGRLLLEKRLPDSPPTTTVQPVEAVVRTEVPSDEESRAIMALVQAARDEASPGRKRPRTTPAPSEPGLASLRRYLNYRADETSEILGTLFRLDGLTIERGWLVATIDLQFAPPSREFIHEQAKEWTSAITLRQRFDEKHLAGLDVRVTLLSSIGNDRVILWGSWRVLKKYPGRGGWSPGPGMELLLQ